MVLMLSSAAIGCFLLVLGGVVLQKRYVECFIYLVIIGVTLLFGAGFRLYNKIPNGMPMGLTEDGIYQVRIVALHIPAEKNESESIGVLLLKKEGKTDPVIPLYRKIPITFFRAGDQKDLVVSREMKIELRTFNYQKIEVKQK